ncbi:MAG TPA: hypothetical protein VML19_10460 [Verrucomicrobiae bacterium]|nr:hypothetical protein [Verrucomicrobiae bacterium]
MRAALLLSLLAPLTAPAQIILPAEEAATFFARSDLKTLKCRIAPIHPELDFSFRYRAGYTVRVPFDQYRGAGHRWKIIVQVQPETDGEPVAFLDEFDLPAVPNSDADGEVEGTYMLGDGRYQAKFQLVDDQGRGCRAQWTITAQPGIWGHGVKVAVPPGTIQEVALRTSRSVSAAPALRRLTVFLHAASSSMNRVEASDVVTLLSALASLLDLAPAQSVRLVVFNLDQQKEIYRQDNFTPDRIHEVRQAIFNLQLGTVDVQTLQNAAGRFDLLAKLVNSELNASDRPEAVVFLGPPALSMDQPPDLFRKLPRSAPKFFYVRYQPPTTILAGRGQIARPAANSTGMPDASMPAPEYSPAGDTRPPGPVPIAYPARAIHDTIDYLVAMLKGKTLIVRTPGEFAGAMREIAPPKRRK